MRPAPLVGSAMLLSSIPIRQQESSKNVPATRIYVNGDCPLNRNERPLPCTVSTVESNLAFTRWAPWSTT